jgi:hypothetical protein
VLGLKCAFASIRDLLDLPVVTTDYQRVEKENRISKLLTRGVVLAHVFFHKRHRDGVLDDRLSDRRIEAGHW